MKINQIEMPATTSFEVQISDIDNGETTTRNAYGEMVRDRIAVKRKLMLEWKFLDVYDMSLLLQEVQSEFFEVEYFDPESGNNQTRTFYVSDRNAPLQLEKSDGVYLWQGLKMSFTER